MGAGSHSGTNETDVLGKVAALSPTDGYTYSESLATLFP